MGPGVSRATVNWAASGASLLESRGTEQAAKIPTMMLKIQNAVAKRPKNRIYKSIKMNKLSIYKKRLYVLNHRC
jgi:hypothetical protein